MADYAAQRAKWEEGRGVDLLRTFLESTVLFTHCLRRSRGYTLQSGCRMMMLSMFPMCGQVCSSLVLYPKSFFFRSTAPLGSEAPLRFARVTQGANKGTAHSPHTPCTHTPCMAARASVKTHVCGSGASASMVASVHQATAGSTMHPCPCIL